MLIIPTSLRGFGPHVGTLSTTFFSYPSRLTDLLFILPVGRSRTNKFLFVSSQLTDRFVFCSARAAGRRWESKSTNDFCFFLHHGLTYLFFFWPRAEVGARSGSLLFPSQSTDRFVFFGVLPAGSRWVPTAQGESEGRNS